MQDRTPSSLRAADAARPPDPDDATAQPSAEALLLTCMDFRLPDAVHRYMAGRGLSGAYDHIILAGASLGALTHRYPAWSVTFRNHLALAVELHGIRRVLLLDHRDCAAYRHIFARDLAADPDDETTVHAQQLAAVRDAIKRQHPTLAVEMLLMSLDGAVEQISET
jgi:carbonic anhydrase